jgi:hypothetical protein
MTAHNYRTSKLSNKKKTCWNQEMTRELQNAEDFNQEIDLSRLGDAVQETHVEYGVQDGRNI